MERVVVRSVLEGARMHQTALLLLARDRFMNEALGGSLWTNSTPSTVGVVLAAFLVALGVLAAVRLLREAPGAPALLPTSDPLAAELAAFAEARRRIEAELAGPGSGAVRPALASLLAGPLLDLDRRVARLGRTAGACDAATLEREELRLESEEQRLRLLLRTEEDPRARALLEASLQDVEGARRLQGNVERRARLARLEVSRLRMLLEALPARLRELAAAEALAHGDTSDAEDIARQLEQAVQSTSDVLADVEQT